MAHSRRKTPRVVFLGCAYLAACGSDFVPYNRLEGLRVLAVRAEPSRPTLAETTYLEAAVFNPDAAAPSYAWSWCPWRAGTERGYGCAASEADLEAYLSLSGAPATSIEYELGGEERSRFRSPLPEASVVAICAGLATDPPPPFVPDCVDGFPVSIGLEVYGADRRISTIKEVVVRLDENAPANTNPVVTGLRLGRKPTHVEDAESVPAAGERLQLIRGETYELFAEVSSEAAELYTPNATEDDPRPAPRRELLLLTWFVEAGETKRERTNFIEGEVGLSEATHNEWTFPDRETYGAAEAKIILVIRDDRGGVGWLERSVGLVDP